MLVDFWWFMTMACLLWYSTITVYVTIHGAKNIRSMLRRLGDQQLESAADPDTPAGH